MPAGTYQQHLRPNTMAGFDAWIYYIMKRKGARDACARTSP
jgi:hypothetical protein